MKPKIELFLKANMDSSMTELSHLTPRVNSLHNLKLIIHIVLIVINIYKTGLVKMEK